MKNGIMVSAVIFLFFILCRINNNMNQSQILLNIAKTKPK